MKKIPTYFLLVLLVLTWGFELCAQEITGYDKALRCLFDEDDDCDGDKKDYLVSLKSYIALYQLFFDRMVAEKALPSDYEKRFDEGVALLDNNEDDLSGNLVLISELHLQRGILEYQEGNNISAVGAFSKAYAYWQNSERDHPGLLANEKLNGIFNLLIGNLPQPYGEWGSWLGYKGDVSKGFASLRGYLRQQEPGSGAHLEALLYMGFSYLKFGEDDTAIRGFVKEASKIDLPVFIKSIIVRCAFKIREPEICANWLLQPCDTSYTPFAYLQGKHAVQKGIVSANEKLEHSLTGPNCQFKADALRHLSWIRFMDGDTLGFYQYQNKIREIKVYPTSKDRQAKFESELEDLPDVVLLKARLLFDAGKYAKALEYLGNYQSQGNEIELCYRKGRCYHLLGKKDKAIMWYRNAIATSSVSKRYFAPYASLYLAEMMIAEGKMEEARRYLKKAKELNRGEYKFSISQKIKRMSAGC